MIKGVDINIIGGKFGLPEKIISNPDYPHFLLGNPVLLFNGRSGIKLALDSLKPENIWLPSYLCQTIISAVNPEASHIRFYPIDDHLRLENLDFIDEIRNGDFFLFIDYFGFPFDRSLLQELKGKRAILFQDCSQALFSEWDEEISDFCLYSPRKFLGVPDGGILKIGSNYHPARPGLEEPPEEVFMQLFWAVVKRREFDVYGDENHWNRFFIEGEEGFTPGYSRMSDLSYYLLRNSFDFEAISRIRRKNYQTLLDSLGEFAIFQDLPDSVVPLGFPIKVENRDHLQRELFREKIFPPIHWVIEGVVPTDFYKSHLLSQRIMTLPCDQRYGEEEMEHIAKSLLKIKLV